jgi:hypothetical protein
MDEGADGEAFAAALLNELDAEAGLGLADEPLALVASEPPPGEPIEPPPPPPAPAPEEDVPPESTLGG